MVMKEDVPLCYPSDYYTHSDANNSKGIETLPDGNSISGLRQAIRWAVISAVKGTPQEGRVGKLGYWLSLSRNIRERAFFNRVMDEMLPHSPTSFKALDIGCGNGRLVAALNSVGWQAEGIDFDSVSTQNARISTGLPIWPGDFRQVSLPPKSYGLVVMSHVIEHLEDTISGLARVSDLLAPGGKVVLISPNPESFGAKVFGPDWFPWEAPRHLILPTINSFKECAARLKFSVERIYTTARYAAAFLNHSRMYREGEVPDLTYPQSLIRERLLALVEKALVRLGQNCGEELIVVLRKPAII